MSIEMETKEVFEPKIGFEKSIDKEMSLSLSNLDQNSIKSESFFPDSEEKESERPLEEVEQSDPGESRGLNEAFFQENSECASATVHFKFFNTLEEKTELNLISKENDQPLIIKSPSQTVGKIEDQQAENLEKVQKNKPKNCCQRLCDIF